MSVEEIRSVQSILPEVNLDGVRSHYAGLVRALRRAGISVSDRRAVKLQRLVASSAVLCGRIVANATDLWVLRHVWDTEEQREPIAAIVDKAIDRAEAADFENAHPRARGRLPDPEELAREIERIGAALKNRATAGERAVWLDRLGLLAARAAWIQNDQQREFVEAQVRLVWSAAGEDL
jgi:MoxR-like ATPase